MDGNRLFRIREIAHYTLSEYIERATEEDFVGGRSDNVNLHIEGKAIKGERDVTREAERAVDC